MLEDKLCKSAIEKDLIDQYQSALHIDDKTKLDALSLYNQYESKHNITSVLPLLPLGSDEACNYEVRNICRLQDASLSYYW